MHYENAPARTFAVRARIAYALALASCLSALFLAGLPVSAHADELGGAAADGAIIDKADFYSEAPLDTTDDVELMATLTPMNLSDEMKYFARFESSQNYAQTFSSGDGYNAMGYYQFDRRYGLQNFIVACYEYDPVTFAMFEPYAEIGEDGYYVTSIKKMTIREQVVTGVDEDGEEIKEWRFTEEAAAVNAAWKAAYEADPVAFSGLQDAWAYKQYYLPAYNYLLSYHGIDLNERADCVKGLCWGMSSLFGSSGWRKFVGGVSDGYDWDGVYHYLDEGVEWPGCGLDPNMTDEEFVTALCDYAIENIPVFYKGQPQYHEGWTNRYKKEKAICLEFLENAQPEGPEGPVFENPTDVTLAPDVKKSDWYYKNGAYTFVVGNKIMEGYTAGSKAGMFAASDTVTRAQAVTILWRFAGKPLVETNSSFSDVASDKWYTDAVNWAVANGITTGYTAGANAGKFGTDDKVTREQLATFIYRYASAANPYAAGFDAAALGKMADAKAVSAYSKDALAWCVDKGIITGVAKGGKMYAQPKENAQRGAVATMIHRLYTNLV